MRKQLTSYCSVLLVMVPQLYDELATEILTVFALTELLYN